MSLWLWLGGLTRENATGRRTGDSSGGLGVVVICIQFWGAPAAQESPRIAPVFQSVLLNCSLSAAKRGASVDVPVNVHGAQLQIPHCVNRLASLSTKPENTQPTPQLTLITTYLINLTLINPLPVEWFTPVECDAVAMFLCGRSTSGQRVERTR